MLQSHRVDTVDYAQLRLQVRFRPMLTGALGSFRSGNSQKLVEDDGATDQYRTAANIDKNAAKYLRLQRLGFGNRTVPFEIRRNTYLLILLVKLEAASLQSMKENGACGLRNSDKEFCPKANQAPPAIWTWPWQ